VVDGVADHFGRLGLVYLAIRRGQTHRAKAEGGALKVQFSESMVLHCFSPDLTI
jgi:hypothetical protein